MAKLRVMIVDDHEVVRIGLKSLLSHYERFEVVGEAGSAKEALDQALRLHPDIVLMDIRLPYEDGYSALRKIRQSGRLKDVPVIAVTAEASTEQMNKARQSGFNGFLGKPLDPDLFPDQIQRILAGEPVWEMSY